MTHVYPLNDTLPHRFDTHLCACRPSIRFEDEVIVVIHNSFDGREYREAARDLIDEANGLTLRKAASNG
jgi:hypothetical protein